MNISKKDEIGFQMNKDAEGNEYVFKTPQTNYWGIVTGVLVPSKGGGVACKDIDPEPGDLKFVMNDINISEILYEVQTEIVVAWILENVDSSDVPADEGNDEALIYNLVHLARDGVAYEPYAYKPHQDKEIKSWDM